jgi:hypothetical protein
VFVKTEFSIPLLGLTVEFGTIPLVEHSQGRLAE